MCATLVAALIIDKHKRDIASLRASVTSVATNRQGILMILALHTVDCFGYRLAMTQNSACKIFHCHVERQRNISWKFQTLFFRQGGQGGYLP